MSEKKDKSKIDNEANNEDEKVVETEKISDEDPNDINVNELNEPDDGCLLYTSTLPTNQCV